MFLFLSISKQNLKEKRFLGLFQTSNYFTGSLNTEHSTVKENYTVSMYYSTKVWLAFNGTLWNRNRFWHLMGPFKAGVLKKHINRKGWGQRNIFWENFRADIEDIWWKNYCVKWQTHPTQITNDQLLPSFTNPTLKM